MANRRPARYARSCRVLIMLPVTFPAGPRVLGWVDGDLRRQLLARREEDQRIRHMAFPP